MLFYHFENMVFKKKIIIFTYFLNVVLKNTYINKLKIKYKILHLKLFVRNIKKYIRYIENILRSQINFKIMFGI